MKKQKNSVFQLLLFILVGIFLAQIFIHLIFHFKPDLKHFVDMISSALLMVILLLPVLYKFVFRPMSLEISQRQRAEEERKKTILNLQEALADVKTLSGLLPICASCKKIRDDTGYWNQIESYIRDNSEVDFTHSICPQCAKELYPNLKICDDSG